MRRAFRAGSLPPGVLLVLSACTGGADGERPDVAAQAGEATLSTEQLAGWIARVPNRQPTRREAETVSLVWVDYSLLAQAVAQGRPLADSAMVASALHPDRMMLTLRAWHDTVVSRRSRPEGVIPDSLYASDSLRLLQHILVRIEDPRDVRVIGAARELVDSLVTLARGGADFAKLAQRHSQDPSGVRGGYLPLARRGQLSPEFERAVWRLAPGTVGAVVGRAGLHVIRRPPLDEVRDRFLAWADSIANRAADSVHADSIRAARRFAIAGSAVSVLRAYFDNPASRERATTPLATWDTGELRFDRVAPWIDLLPPASFADLAGGSDLALEGFVRDVGLQYLLLEEAEAQGIGVPPTRWAELVRGYHRALREALDLLGVSGTPPTLSADQVEPRVAALMEGLTAERVRWRPLPSALGATLRAESGYRLHRRGLNAAAEAALETVRASTP